MSYAIRETFHDGVDTEIRHTQDMAHSLASPSSSKPSFQRNSTSVPELKELPLRPSGPDTTKDTTPKSRTSVMSNTLSKSTAFIVPSMAHWKEEGSAGKATSPKADMYALAGSISTVSDIHPSLRGLLAELTLITTDYTRDLTDFRNGTPYCMPAASFESRRNAIRTMQLQLYARSVALDGVAAMELAAPSRPPLPVRRRPALPAEEPRKVSAALFAWVTSLESPDKKDREAKGKAKKEKESKSSKHGGLKGILKTEEKNKDKQNGPPPRKTVHFPPTLSPQRPRPRNAYLRNTRSYKRGRWAASRYSDGWLDTSGRRVSEAEFYMPEGRRSAYGLCVDTINAIRDGMLGLGEGNETAVCDDEPECCEWEVKEREDEWASGFELPLPPKAYVGREKWHAVERRAAAFSRPRSASSKPASSASHAARSRAAPGSALLARGAAAAAAAAAVVSKKEATSASRSDAEVTECRTCCGCTKESFSRPSASQARSSNNFINGKSTSMSPSPAKTTTAVTLPRNETPKAQAQAPASEGRKTDCRRVVAVRERVPSASDSSSCGGSSKHRPTTSLTATNLSLLDSLNTSTQTQTQTQKTPPPPPPKPKIKHRFSVNGNSNSNPKPKPKPKPPPRPPTPIPMLGEMLGSERDGYEGCSFVEGGRFV
ncbi:uncharacterized protein K452DRAFT_341276 [Aplosporella prunicola CBS 121167]|uniref:Uncharacterized protein n=1 Tax=Aplosporella prunicola CBS 121167 TaxID=1176127 RepID=A0A6A6B3J7_9PEZI|nr:uncharacterized protein K452DRAFT_341276 [Aplosporella prunicola CBS 121167]KAF2137301.1 hypothetical protein K452DRAFT_341276 [Aplosporella prunicola CBS 121167]